MCARVSREGRGSERRREKSIDRLKVFEELLGDAAAEAEAKCGVCGVYEGECDGGGKKASLEAGMRLMVTEGSAELEACGISSSAPLGSSAFFTSFFGTTH